MNAARTAPRLDAFSVFQYKAFGSLAEVELGRITLLLGRNNAGKSALLFAPLLLTHALDPTAEVPFPAELEGVSFGSSVQSMSFRRNPTGFEGCLRFGSGPVSRVELAVASLSERKHEQLLRRLALTTDSGPS